MEMLEIRRVAHLQQPQPRRTRFANPIDFGLDLDWMDDEVPPYTFPSGENDITLPITVLDARDDEGRLDPVANDLLFRGLVKEYGASLYYFVLKRVGHPDDAADITQQAFVEAACSLTSYRREAEISTWIFGIATNLARNHVNRAPQYRHRFETDEILEGCESPDLSPCESMSQRQALDLVSEAIATLPLEMSQALKLVAVEELSYEDASIELNVPVGTVRSRVSRARAAVRKYMRDAGYSPAED
ncbi:MAG TPA: RNA polymerase sigma factor [Ramlibacter sp.]|uniref:RNA polymerase sigma factor n=1 Tax=Ramlibacter sp. TaxID=1917967 RepID=UPI002C14AB1B|nr:RNA polymerase sigma factor [Ramlibacter sp.]HVZ45041.1 RNA polymerase sigma factor [Ramlibacter sp.]